MIPPGGPGVSVKTHRYYLATVAFAPVGPQNCAPYLLGDDQLDSLLLAGSAGNRGRPSFHGMCGPLLSPGWASGCQCNRGWRGDSHDWNGCGQGWFGGQCHDVQHRRDGGGWDSYGWDSDGWNQPGGDGWDGGKHCGRRRIRGGCGCGRRAAGHGWHRGNRCGGCGRRDARDGRHRGSCYGGCGGRDAWAGNRRHRGRCCDGCG